MGISFSGNGELRPGEGQLMANRADTFPSGNLSVLKKSFPGFLG